MSTKQAKTLGEDSFNRLVAYAVQRSKVPTSDRLKLELSFRAGLRSCEIASLKVSDMVDADGQPARYITVFRGKGGKKRAVAMHKEVRVALLAFMKAHPTKRYVAISSRQRRGRQGAMTANALTQWFYHLYKRAGFVGCSSHSGRRTFGTAAARAVGQLQHHQTIADVQRLLGHSRLNTTGLYIEPSKDTYDFVNSIRMETTS